MLHTSSPTWPIYPHGGTEGQEEWPAPYWPGSGRVLTKISMRALRTASQVRTNGCVTRGESTEQFTPKDR